MIRGQRRKSDVQILSLTHAGGGFDLRQSATPWRRFSGYGEWASGVGLPWEHPSRFIPLAPLSHPRHTHTHSSSHHWRRPRSIDPIFVVAVVVAASAVAVHVSQHEQRQLQQQQHPRAKTFGARSAKSVMAAAESVSNFNQISTLFIFSNSAFAKLKKKQIYCNGTALPPERFCRMTTRWPASAIRSRKLSINVAIIKAWARPTLEILPKSQNHTNEYFAKCVTSYFLVWLVVTRLVIIRYSKHSPGLRLSFVSLR